MRPRGSRVSRSLLALALAATIVAAAACGYFFMTGQRDATARRLAQQDYLLLRTAARLQREFTGSQAAIGGYARSGLREYLAPAHTLGVAFRRDVHSVAALAPANLQALVRAQRQAGVALFAVADRIGGLPPRSAAAQDLATKTVVTARDFAIANSRFSGELATSAGTLSARSGRSLGARFGWSAAALAVAVLLLIAAAVSTAQPADGPLRALAAAVRRRAGGDRAARAGPAGVAPAPAAPAPAAAGEPGEQAVSRQDSGLAALDPVRSDFLATISHELRAPLTTIEGYVEMLADDGPDQVTPAQQKMLDSISRSAVRLRNLVDDVFTLARLESGATSLATRPVNLPDVITAAAEAVRPAVAAASLSLTCTGPETGMTVAGDAGQLERVMINLLSNAVKFTPGEGDITVTAAPEDEWGVVTVADSGIGIPERDQKELFTRFFRASNAREQAIPGTGLGLAIVRTIMISHGGEVEVDSREGSGTTVTVRLPLQRTPGA
jgi:signal transduction histidine kinase